MSRTEQERDAESVSLQPNTPTIGILCCKRLFSSYLSWTKASGIRIINSQDGIIGQQNTWTLCQIPAWQRVYCMKGNRTMNIYLWKYKQNLTNVYWRLLVSALFFNGVTPLPTGLEREEITRVTGLVPTGLAARNWTMICKENTPFCLSLSRWVIWPRTQVWIDLDDIVFHLSPHPSLTSAMLEIR